MAQNKILNIEPIALTTTLTTTLLNCAISSLSGPTGYTQTQPYLLIKHIRVVNYTAASVTFSLFKGSSDADDNGTSVVGNGLSVAAYSAYDWYGLMRFDSGDYLTGGASANSSLVLQAEGEIGLS